MHQNNLPLIDYIFYLGDNTMILSQRLGEWCGHGPVLEQDIAITNIALDLLGQSRLYYQYAAKLIGEGTTEDDLAFIRKEQEYNNMLLVEQPNGDWGQTTVRQFLFDSWHYYFLEQLIHSKDIALSEIAQKSIKEVAYHLRYSSEWMIRLGDGTEESHTRMQNGLNELWRFSKEPLLPADYELALLNDHIAVDLAKIETAVGEKRKDIIRQATLTIPKDEFMHTGGKKGTHTEHMGYILTELQYMQRTYPGLEW